MNTLDLSSPYWGEQIVPWIFMVLALLKGIYFSRRFRDRNIREYSMTDRRFDAPLLTLSFMATMIDGFQIQGFPAQIFTDGLIQLLSRFGTVIGFLFFGWFIAPRFMNFKGAITLGDIAFQLFGKVGRITIGIVGTLTSMLSVSFQIIVLATLGASLLRLPPTYVVLLGGLILLLYSALGGVKAISIMSQIQFISLVFFLLLLVGAIIHHNHGLVSLIDKMKALHPEKLQITKHSRFSVKLLKGISNIFIIALFFMPAYIQRLLMASNKTEARKLLFYCAGLRSLFLIAITILAFGGLLAFPKISPQDLIPHLSQNLLPPGIRAFFATGMLAVIMSTADSHLTAGALTFSHDVIKPLSQAMGRKINDEVLEVRIITFVMGFITLAYTILRGVDNPVVSIFTRFHFYDILGIILVPLTLGIVGFKTNRVSLVASIGTGVLLLIIRSICPLGPVGRQLAYLLTTASTAIAFLIAHYWVYGKFTFMEIVKRNNKEPVTMLFSEIMKKHQERRRRTPGW